MCGCCPLGDEKGLGNVIEKKIFLKVAKESLQLGGSSEGEAPGSTKR